MKNLGKLSLGILTLTFIGEIFVPGLTPTERAIAFIILLLPSVYIFQTLRK